MGAYKGTVSRWLNYKGIGFITPEGQESGQEAGTDILVHFSNIKQEAGPNGVSLEEGSVVEYELESDPKNPEKQVAVNVTGEGGADATPMVKGKGKGKKGKGKGKKGKGKGKKGKGKDGEEGGEEAEE